VSDFDAGVSRLSFQFNNELRQHGYYNGAYAVAMPPPYFGLSRHKADYDRNRTLPRLSLLFHRFVKKVFGEVVFGDGQALCWLAAWALPPRSRPMARAKR
jgi:hypothetical protein